MYLSVVITGPICLFNRGNIIAWQGECLRVLVHMFVRLEDAYGTVASAEDWRDAIGLCVIRELVQQLSVYLLIRTTPTEVSESRGSRGPPQARDRERTEDMCQTYCITLALACVSTRCSEGCVLCVSV